MVRNNSGSSRRAYDDRARDNRMNILAELYKKNYSYREMQAEVKKRLNLEKYALSTVKKDIDKLTKEWHEYRMHNFDQNVTTELVRIDNLIREAWEGWEKSKEDYDHTTQKQKGPNPDKMNDIVTTQLERVTKGEHCCGDVRLLEFIGKQLVERRRLLGLYAAEKRELTGTFTFEQALIETGVEDDGE